jgi:cell division protein ZapB
MSLIDEVCDLESRIQNLHQKCLRLQQENRILHENKQFLKQQCDELLKKNDIAKTKVTQLISQLTQMEAQND